MLFFGLPPILVAVFGWNLRILQTMDDTAKNGSCWTRAKDYGKNPLDTKRLRGKVSQAYL